MADKTINTELKLSGERAYKEACDNINKALKNVSSEMALVTAEFGKNNTSVEGLTAKQSVLQNRYDEQTKKIEAARQAIETYREAGVKPTDEELQKLERDLNYFQAALIKTEKEIQETEKSLAETAETTGETGDEVKNLGKAADETREKTSVFGDVLKATLSAEAIKVGISAIIDGIKSVANAMENSVRQFGELEQNLGGSEAIFQDYANHMQKIGEDAYKNMGATQSQYLETANKMGALFQGSGIEVQKSAELTEKAMQRAADMASVMGIDVQVALDSVSGAAKGNYSMMDNLGVAMNATSIEAYALAQGLDFTWQTATQAEKAEVAMQMFFENTEKYAGNFALESTQTISGSIGMLQAAVSSFTAGIGNANADMENLTRNLVDAFRTASDNVIPVLENMAEALPEAVEIALSEIDNIAPELIDAAVGLVYKMMEAVSRSLPMVADMGAKILQHLADSISESSPELVPVAVEIVLTIVDTLIENADELIDAAIEIIASLGDGLVTEIQKQEFWDKIAKIITKTVSLLIEYAPKLIEAGTELIVQLVEGLLSEESIAALTKALATIGEYIYNGFISIGDEFKKAGKYISQKTAEGIEDGKPFTTAAMESIFDIFMVGSKASEANAWRAGNELPKNYGDGVNTGAKKIDFSELREKLKEQLSTEGTNLEEFGFQLGENFSQSTADGVEENSDKPKKAVEKMLKGTYDEYVLAIKDYRNQTDYLIEGEIAMWESLGSRYDEMSEKRINAETEVTKLRKKLVDQQANDVKSAFKAEEDAIKAREKVEKESLQEIEKANKNFYEEKKLLIEDYKNSAEYTLAGELAMYEEFRNNYSELSKERVEIDKNIANLQKQIAAETQKVYEEMIKEIVSALKVQYEQASEIEQYHLDKQVAAVKESTEEKITEYRREYDEKIRLIDETSQAEIRALQDKLDIMDEQDQSDKAYENTKKLIELNQAIVKAQMGNGDLAKAQEAYNAEIKRQQDERVAAEKKAQKDLLQAQIKGIEDAAAEKKKMLDEQTRAMEEAYAEQEKYFAHVADLEIQIASTKNEELRKLLQDELDEYKRVNEEKVKASFDTRINDLYDEKINELNSKLLNSTGEAEKARLQKQLDALERFKGEYFDNVTLLQERLNNLTLEAEKEAALNKQKALAKQHYKELNEAENIEAEARRLMIKDNEDTVIALLSEYNEDWKKQGEDYPANMQEGMKKGFADLTAYVNEAMKAVSTGLSNTTTSKEIGISDMLNKDLAEIEKYTSKYQLFGENLSAAFKAGVNPVQETISNMTSDITETISAGIAEAESVIRTKNDEIITLFEEYTPKWLEAGASLVDSLTEGANFQILIDKAHAAFTEIWNALSTSSAVADETAAYDPWANIRNMTVAERMELADSPLGRASSGNLVVNINQPVESPAEVAREVKNAAVEMGFSY